MTRFKLSHEQIDMPRTPKTLSEFVDVVFAMVGSDKSERRLGMRRKGVYKRFLDEIVPLSRFARISYPETWQIQPVYGIQGYDALVFDDSNREVDRVEVTRPHDGRGVATDARLAINRGYGEIWVGDPGDDFEELVPFIVCTCKKKARNDYADCTLVVAVDPLPPWSLHENLREHQICGLVDRLAKIEFKARRIFLLILPNRLLAIEKS